MSHNTMPALPMGYTISTDMHQMDVAAIHKFLCYHSYWSRGIPVNVVEKAITHSLNFGIFFEKKQVGYARVISDHSTIAYLGDVYVLEEHRHKGLGKALMQAVMGHTDLQAMRRWILLTADAHNLYQQFGWQPIERPEVWMEIHSKDLYLQNKFG